MKTQILVFRDFVTNAKNFPHGTLLDVKEFFTERGWSLLEPYQKKTRETHLVEEFFSKEPIFTDCSHTTDTYTAFKAGDDESIAAAFSFAVWEAEQHLIGYVFTTLVAEKHRRQGHLREFMETLKDFMVEHTLKVKSNGSCCETAFILAGMSHETKPHNAFYRLGFTTDVPEHLNCLE
jgi:hypothetical protein